MALFSKLEGTAMRIRHLRNGVEQPPLAMDNHYDFNYQSLLVFDEPRTVEAVWQPSYALALILIYDFKKQ
jgi:hypothetical protein